jgi:RNA polymerase sigma-70 factor, ECF subfamily
MAAEDLAFLAKLRAHDEAAFARLLRDYGGRMLRVARRLLPSEEDARDAVQDAFISAFRSIDRFESDSRLSTWLHRIVVNCCLMRLRTKRRHPEEDLEELLPQFKSDGHQLHPSVPWPESAEDLVQQVQNRKMVREAIAMLPDNYRAVLVMRELEEMTTEETAEALGITPNAVKIRLHRARQALRTLLDRKVRGGVR